MSSIFKPPGAPLNAPRRATLLGLAALSLGVWNARAASDTMDYRYWEWGKTPKSDEYHVAALTLALQKTVQAYGAFSVLRVPENMSTSRVRREVYAGKRVNIHIGPWRDVAAGNPEERNYLISTPVLGGLLGYRRLMVRTEDLPKFEAITNAEQLKKLMAGQGRNWVDVAVLRNNGYRVEDSGNLATLVDMLVNKRFDYLPLSVVEADTVLEQNPQLAGKLTLAPALMLYYPLPAMFYVSARERQLAERLEAGLATAKRDGSLDELTARYFQKEIQQVKASANRCFILTNPLLPKIYAEEPPRLLTR